MKIDSTPRTSSPWPSPPQEERGRRSGVPNWRKDSQARANFSNFGNLSASLTPSPPYAYGGEGRGEEVVFSGKVHGQEAAILEGPSPQSSPHSFLAGRGGKIEPFAAIRRVRPVAAFTLLEVMLAVTIFFMAMFAILGLLTSGVRAASMLRNNGPTAGMIIAQLSATNILEEGSQSGNFKDVPIYEGYDWLAVFREVDTNGLFQVDVIVRDSKNTPCSTMSALLYRPDSEKNNKLGLQQQPGQR